MDAQIINVYVERLLKEVTELTKTKLLLETQLIVTQQLNSELSSKIEAYQKAEEKQLKKAAKNEQTF